jgi:hypothetical protein
LEEKKMIKEKPDFHAGTFIATNMLTNLCESCYDCFADCANEVIEFGYGVGNDNVVKCDCYNGPGSCDIIYCDL